MCDRERRDAFIQADGKRTTGSLPSADRDVELWLRRLVQEQFEQQYSNDILKAKNAAGEFVLNKEVREHIEKYLRGRPGRYNRPVDAALLDDLITIICKPNTYTSCFATALAGAFPLGNEEARHFLKRLLAPRNNLSHANAISIRQAEQVICYSNDVVYALRDFYAMKGKADAYNAPRILRMWDSFGHMEHAQAAHANQPHKFDYSDDPASHLRPGDTLTIEIEVDPSFSDEGFTVKWSAGYVDDQRGERLAKIRPSCRKPACSTRDADHYKNYFASGLASPSVVGRSLAGHLPRFASDVSLGISSVCVAKMFDFCNETDSSRNRGDIHR